MCKPDTAIARFDEVCNNLGKFLRTAMRRTSMVGWLAVGISTIITCLWAFWGTFEAFHEGWYFELLRENLICTTQYLALMLIFLVLSVIPLRWPRTGAMLYQAFGIGLFVWICMTRRVLTLSAVIGMLPMTLPPLFVGILFWTGRPKPVNRAYRISVFLPLIVTALCAIEPVTRIAGRVDDGDCGVRVIEGNRVKLIWAPEGPGFMGSGRLPATERSFPWPSGALI